jgi:hypothetical protein
MNLIELILLAVLSLGIVVVSLRLCASASANGRSEEGEY